ncbi:hypothetical protein [Methylobacterium dankookense]|uniref:hypothetical protein n=1 Tax=Methylobacterium dankookense TaxID=560405 RepID=UPI0011A48FC2|nr:hypothetical protein [Methylobacterium dankookense]
MGADRQPANPSEDRAYRPHACASKASDIGDAASAGCLRTEGGRQIAETPRIMRLPLTRLPEVIVSLQKAERLARDLGLLAK